MRPNRVRQLLASGQPVLNGWLLLPDSLSAELMSHAGFDSLTVDMQHGMIDFQSALSMLTAISTTQTTPLVRVPWLDPGLVMKTLDAGAYGVICPMINSRQQAQQFVAATRYAPTGNRSFGPLRAALYAGDDYALHANDTVLNLAMIETAQALDKIDDILSVEGLDAIYIGPADLSLSMKGKAVHDTMEGDIGDAIRHILARAKAHNVFAGTHTSSTQFALKMLELGFRFVTCCNDTRLIAAGASNAVREMRGGLKQ